jgi:hypothetical protein
MDGTEQFSDGEMDGEMDNGVDKVQKGQWERNGKVAQVSLVSGAERDESWNRRGWWRQGM